MTTIARCAELQACGLPVAWVYDPVSTPGRRRLCTCCAKAWGRRFELKKPFGFEIEKGYTCQNKVPR
jgi:hypothetical protein